MWKTGGGRWWREYFYGTWNELNVLENKERQRKAGEVSFGGGGEEAHGDLGAE